MTDEAATSILEVTGSYLDEFDSDPPPVLVPAFSLHGERAWMVAPSIRTVTVVKGSGRNARPVTEQVPHMIAVSSDWDFVPYDEVALRLHGLQPHPKPFIPKPPFRWRTEDIKRYVRDQQTGRSTKDVFEELVDVFRDYVEFGDSVYYELMALYVMQSYMFTVWPTTGYLHFNGTLASGKSRCLDVLECVAFNARQGSSFSNSVVYRMLEGAPGVLCMDEQEMFKTDEGKVLYSQLLGGYRTQGAAYVNEKGKNEEWTPTAYSLYGPKAIASIKQVDPTLASRSIIIPMVPAVKQPSELPTDPAAWHETIHDLCVWALQNAAAISKHTQGWNRHARFARAPTLINRSWEVARPYLVIADTFDPALTNRMTTFFAEYFVEQARRMQETDRALVLLRSLPRVLKNSTPRMPGFYSIKDIHTELLELLDADQRDYFKSSHIHSHMTTLRFTDKRMIGSANHYRLDPEQVRETLRARSVQPLEEDRDWFEGKVTYGKAPIQQEKPVMDTFFDA